MSDRLEMGRLREGFKMIGAEGNQADGFTDIDNDDGEIDYEYDVDSDLDNLGDPAILEFERLVSSAILNKASSVVVPLPLAQDVLTELFLGSFGDDDSDLR